MGTDEFGVGKLYVQDADGSYWRVSNGTLTVDSITSGEINYEPGYDAVPGLFSVTSTGGNYTSNMRHWLTSAIAQSGNDTQFVEFLSTKVQDIVTYIVARCRTTPNYYVGIANVPPERIQLFEPLIAATEADEITLAVQADGRFVGYTVRFGNGSAVKITSENDDIISSYWNEIWLYGTCEECLMCVYPSVEPPGTQQNHELDDFLGSFTIIPN